ncbi:hypothetical protein [Streptosporangium sandarakinum]|uniref:hypothetical protein n=1 Tax=Streptosporangium sandarakinum TaxID=1260955 RepID=UPI00372499B8
MTETAEAVHRDPGARRQAGLATVADAQAYLSTELFTQDVVTALQPYLNAAPDVRIYETA